MPVQIYSIFLIVFQTNKFVIKVLLARLFCNIMPQLQNLIDKLTAFRDALEWAQFHDPRNLALALIEE